MEKMNNPTGLKYSRTDEWLLPTGEGSARIGITDFAQEMMGSIVYVDLPGAGDVVTAGESFGVVESIKSAFEIISPVSGVVAALNSEAIDAPERINAAPYDSWLIEVSDITSQVELLDAEAYRSAKDEE